MYRSMVKKAVGAFLVIAAAINLSACSMQKEKVRYSKAYLEFFDTVTQIVGYEEDEERRCKKTQHPSPSNHPMEARAC